MTDSVQVVTVNGRPKGWGSAASIIQRGITESYFFAVPGRHGWLCLQPVVWTWTTHVTFLSPYFLICQIGILIRTSQSCLQELYERMYIGLRGINTRVPSGGLAYGRSSKTACCLWEALWCESSVPGLWSRWPSTECRLCHLLVYTWQSFSLLCSHPVGWRYWQCLISYGL